MNEEKESLKSPKKKENDKNKENHTNNSINNKNKIEAKDESSSLINDKINEYNNVDEFQKREINKIIRSKYSSQLLSLTEGLSEFTHMAISYYFKDSLKLSLSQSSFYRSLISFPSIIQPFFGLISDLLPIFGYKRKSYLIIGGGINFLLWIILSFINSENMAIIIIFIISFNNTFINACSGGILAEVSKKLTIKNDKLASFNASNIYKNVGMIISCVFGGIASELFGVKIIFILAGGLSLFNVIGGLIYFESKIGNNKEENNYQIIRSISDEEINHERNSNFFSVVYNKMILIPLFLAFFFSSSPSYFESAFYYLTDIKKFNLRHFGHLTIYMKIFFLICSIIYKNYLIEKDKKKVVFWACIISFSSSCFFNIYLTFNLKSKIIVFLSISLYVSIKTICSKPMSDIVLLLSPNGYEGSIMGLFGSAISFGKTISTFFGSLLTAYFKVEKNDYSNFNFMIFVHNIISLLSLFGLLLIDDEILVHAEENSKKKKKSDSNNTEIEVDIYNESIALKEINCI